MNIQSNKPADGKIFIVSGPSGVGKDTVVKKVTELLNSYDMYMASPRSYTTRNIRENNAADKNYIFVDECEFNKLYDEGKMIEKTESHGHLYGMSKDEFQECITSGGNILKILDKVGAARFKELYGDNSVLIFLFPPSIEELEKRLAERGSETKESLNQRMSDSIEEMKDVSGYDYVIVSDDIDIVTAAEIGSIIITTVENSSK